MNAKPKYALISIAIPKAYTKKNLKSLSKGFIKTAKKYNIQIIGGDTISNTKLDISITLISNTTHPTYRHHIKNNDILCYTGDLGKAKKDLNLLFKNKKIDKNSKFLKPKLKNKFFYKASPYINSAIDISDGLFFELQRLSKANNISFEFIKNISKKIGCSGEEYELLFSYNPKNTKIINKIAKKYNVKLNNIAIAKNSKEAYKCKCKKHHF